MKWPVYSVKPYSRWILGTTIIIWFCFNFVSYLFLARFRFDITEQKLFSLSPHSQQLLSELKEPLTIHFFFSASTNQNPVIQRYATRVKALVQQYQYYGNGNITLKFVNPTAFSPQEALAEGYGIEPIPTGHYNHKLYLGLSITNASDDIVTLPFLSVEKEQFLEYDISKAINDMIYPTRKKVGILSTIPTGYYEHINGKKVVMPWASIEQVQSLYDITMVDPRATALPVALDMLIVIQPYTLSQPLIYAIDQYAVNGGKMIIFADPFPEASDPSTYSLKPETDFDRLLRGWGIAIDSSLVIGDRSTATPIVEENSKNQQAISYIPWLSLTKNNVAIKDIALSGLDHIQLAGSGFIQAIAPKSQFTPLIYSTKDSTPLSVETITIASPQELLAQFKPEHINYTLAARLSGPLPSTFTRSPVSGQPHKSGTSQAAAVILFADTDLLQDRFWVQTQHLYNQRILLPFMDNGSLLLNLLDQLAQRERFIHLRGKPMLARPFTVIENLQKRAEQQYLATERSLKQTLSVLEQEQRGIESSPNLNGPLITMEQQQQLVSLKRQSSSLQQELRQVQYSFQQDMEHLSLLLKVIGIGAMPTVVLVLAGFVWFKRQRNAQTIATGSYD